MATRRPSEPKARVRPRQRTVPASAGAHLVEPKAKLTDLAYTLVEEAIVTLRLPPGSVVSEQQLVELTGIGRTPIREAIQRLAREHLIVVLPQRGLLIAETDINKQLKLLETRREIERLICRSAARRARDDERKRFAQLASDFRKAADKNDDVAFIRADREFNDLCLAAARNEFAEGAMRLLHGLSRRFWYIHFKQQRDMRDMARLHAKLSLAIAEGDSKAAGEALDELVDFIEAYTRATLDSDR